MAAAEVKWPGKIIIAREIFDSPRRHASVPELAEGSGTPVAGRPYR
jgi:hypothetical protein